MKVEIEVSNYFLKYVNELSFEEEMDENTSIQSLIEQLGLPYDQIGFVIANNVKVEFDYVLLEGDKIEIFPFIIGG